MKTLSGIIMFISAKGIIITLTTRRHWSTTSYPKMLKSSCGTNFGLPKRNINQSALEISKNCLLTAEISSVTSPKFCKLTLSTIYAQYICTYMYIYVQISSKLCKNDLLCSEGRQRPPFKTK